VSKKKKKAKPAPEPQSPPESLPMPRTPDEWYVEIGGAYAESAQAMSGLEHLHQDPDEFVSFLIAAAMSITELRRGVELDNNARMAAMGRVTEYMIQELRNNQPRYADCPSMVFACAFLQAHVEFEQIPANERDSILSYCDCRLSAQK
jgi:hypothetical protein